MANPTATPVPPTPRPAPQEDRVGFPAGYGETFRLLVVFDRPDNKQVRALCANELAAGIAPGKSFPYGSVLVMETWRAKLDHNGNPVLDANGRFIRETLSGVFAMRKEQGYDLDRSGEAEHTVVTTGAFASKPLKTRLAKPGDHFSVTYVSPGDEGRHRGYELGHTVTAKDGSISSETLKTASLSGDRSTSYHNSRTQAGAITAWCAHYSVRYV